MSEQEPQDLSQAKAFKPDISEVTEEEILEIPLEGIAYLESLKRTPGRPRDNLRGARERAPMIQELTQIGLSSREVSFVLGTTPITLRKDRTRLPSDVSTTEIKKETAFALQFRLFAYLEFGDATLLTEELGTKLFIDQQQRLHTLLLKKLGVTRILAEPLTLSNELRTTDAEYAPYCKFMNTTFGLPSYEMTLDTRSVDEIFAQLTTGVVSGSLVPPSSTAVLKIMLIDLKYMQAIAPQRPTIGPQFAADIESMLMDDRLTTREQEVLRLRFGLNVDVTSMTLQQIGEQFGVSRERIRDIEAKALRKLRHPTRSRTIREYIKFDVDERSREYIDLDVLKEYGLSDFGIFELKISDVYSIQQLEQLLDPTSDRWTRILPKTKIAHLDAARLAAQRYRVDKIES